MSPRVRGRAGFSAPEAIVALLLGLVVTHLGLTTMAALRESHSRMAARTDRLVAMRVARHVLRRELRHGVPGADWWVDDDSLYLRAFRGTALVCGPDTASAEVTVGYRGDRRPDPAKDSVLFFDATGRRAVRALAAVSTASVPCPLASAGEVETWRLDAPPPPGAVVAKLFERGSYHLVSAALRYRRGASGRQPLTPEVWSSATGWSPSEARLGVEVHPADPAHASWSAFLAWRVAP